MIQGRRRVFRSALPCALAALIVCVPFQSAMVAGGSNDLALRPYQKECVQRCVDRNTVVCMDTGTGKTLIAVKVLDHYLQLQPGQRILFLVPTKALVRQQAEYCRKHCSAQPRRPRVKEVCGMETDAWDEIKWNEIFRNHEIIVGTPEPLRAAMDRGFLDPKRVSLVILDECHQATGRHPMAEFIRIVKKLEQALRPRILGLTASFYAGKLKRKRDSEEGRLDLELLLDASLFCPDVPNGKQQEFKQVTWSEDITSSEAFEADFLKEVQLGLDEIAEKLGDAAETKDFRKLGKRMHHVVQQLGRESLEVYVKKCVVRQLKQHCEELQQIQQLPAEERSNVEKLLHKLPLLQELTSKFYSHFTTRPCVSRAPKISAKVDQLFHIISKEKDEAGSGSKGIVFVEQVAITEPLAVALALSGDVKAEAVYGMLAKKDLDAILKRFKEGVTTVLVSTNALEEGIDVADCTWVVRFDKIHTTKDHIQGSGRARADVARIYYFNNDPHEEVSKANVLKTVAQDQSLTLTDEHRKQLQFTSVQAVPGVYPYNDGQPIHLFNCQDIVTKWCQQAFGPSFSADVFAMEPEVNFQIPTPDGVKIFKDDDVRQQWRDVRLDDVEPQDRLKRLSRLDRVKLRAFYTVAVWLREQKCLNEQNLPSPLQLRLTKSVCPLTPRPAALRINGKFERTTIAGGMAGDFKSKLQQLLQQRFPHKSINELLKYEARMEDGWVARVVVYLPDGDRCESSEPCLTKKEAEQAAARKAYEKLLKVS